MRFSFVVVVVLVFGFFLVRFSANKYSNDFVYNKLEESLLLSLYSSCSASSSCLSYEQHTPRIPPAISYQAALHIMPTPASLSLSLSSVFTVESLVTFCLKFKSVVVVVAALFIIR